jgi:hypothetical protein
VISGAPADVRLRAWLERQPRDDVFEVSLTAICAKLESLHFEVRAALLGQLFRDCITVALAADNATSDRKIGSDEGRVLARILVAFKPSD